MLKQTSKLIFVCIFPLACSPTTTYSPERDAEAMQGVLGRWSASGSGITLSLCEDVELADSEAADIERITANYFAVARETIHSKVRDRTTSLARSVAMYLIRRHTRLSFPEIGRLMGNKNHSTVLMAVQRIDRTLDQEGAVTWRTTSGPQEVPLRAVLDTLEQEITRGQRGSA